MEIVTIDKGLTVFNENGKYLTTFEIVPGTQGPGSTTRYIRAYPKFTGVTNPTFWERVVETVSGQGTILEGSSIDVVLAMYTGWKAAYIRDHRTGALYGVIGHPEQAIDDNVITTAVSLRDITLPANNGDVYSKTILIARSNELQATKYINVVIIKISDNNFGVSLVAADTPTWSDNGYGAISESPTINIIQGAESMNAAAVTAQEALTLAQNLESSFDSINSGSYVAI